MNLTTKTAQEIKQIKDIIKRFEGKAVSSETFFGEMNGQTIQELERIITNIISFKNELKEILDDKYPDEPILKYYERIYIRLMKLKTEIESVEKE